MRCQYCGLENADDRTECERCKAPLSSTGNAESTSASPSSSPSQSYGSPPPPPPQQYYQQGPSAPMGAPTPTSIPNYLPWAIAVTVCCCLPGGIAAIIYSSQATSKQAAGDILGAQQAANNAKTWLIVGAVVGFIAQGIYVAAAAAGAFAEMGNMP